MPQTLSGRPTSVWMDTAPHTTYAQLEESLTVDVCVAGGGIVGLMTAERLKRSGRSVAVLEADRVAAGVTGYTTAKVTALHGLIYDEIRSRFGDDGARHYAEANVAGLELIAAIIAEQGIECDFRRRPAFTYAEPGEDTEALRKEVDAARGAGLDAELVDAVDLPWEVAGAVRLADQAEFHPRRFLLAIADAIHGGGSHVFERTRVTAVDDGRPCRVRTDTGAEVAAERVVIATHYPTLDRGLFFTRLAAERSYAIGVRARGRVPEGMFLSTESPSHSVRATPYDGGELLIVGGESHKTGTGGDTTERYARLEAWARERFDVEAVEYRWSAQDAMPVDGIPYVGKLSPIARSVWTASGFKKWGITNGAAAAIMLSDAIAGRENPWAQTFDANRFKPVASAPKLLKETVSVGAHFFGDRLSSPDVHSLDELAPGQGGIVRIDGEKVAAFRDDDGVVHGVSTICTHLFCQVSWSGRSCEHRVLVRVRRGAAAHEHERFGAVVDQLVLDARGDHDAVARPHGRLLPTEPHPARARGEEVDLLRAAVVVRLSRRAGRHGGLRERLVGRVAARDPGQLADLRPVEGDERLALLGSHHVHGRSVAGPASGGRRRAQRAMPLLSGPTRGRSGWPAAPRRTPPVL
jgi:glycine/D-amino acid oxidase-like deaminating enzyme